MGKRSTRMTNTMSVHRARGSNSSRSSSLSFQTLPPFPAGHTLTSSLITSGQDSQIWERGGGGDDVQRTDYRSGHQYMPQPQMSSPRVPTQVLQPPGEPTIHGGEGDDKPNGAHRGGVCHCEVVPQRQGAGGGKEEEPEVEVEHKRDAPSLLPREIDDGRLRHLHCSYKLRPNLLRGLHRRSIPCVHHSPDLPFV